MNKETLMPAGIWNPGSHLFSQCIVVTGAEKTLYLAGQTSIDANGKILGEWNAEEQIRVSFANIATIVAAAGGTLENVVKLTVYFVDLEATLGTYTRVLGDLFPAARPSQTVVQVTRLAMPELLIEIDATAVL
jgi:2-iminobutanoate/2-iminopropanoate deaminase